MPFVLCSVAQKFPEVEKLLFLLLCLLRFDRSVPMQYLSCVWFTKLIDCLVGLMLAGDLTC